MKSTIKSLNSVLNPVRSKTCESQQTCGVATVNIKYLGETGKGKLGTCVPSSACSDVVGCQLALRYLPTDVSNQGCKVLFLLFLLCYMRKTLE